MASAGGAEDKPGLLPARPTAYMGIPFRPIS